MKCRNMSIKFKNVVLFINTVLNLVLLRPFDFKIVMETANILFDKLSNHGP